MSDLYQPINHRRAIRIDDLQDEIDDEHSKLYRKKILPLPANMMNKEGDQSNLLPVNQRGVIDDRILSGTNLECQDG
jgi:hypothetical protein